MSTMPVSNIISFREYLDYVPIVSTVTNIRDIYQKSVIGSVSEQTHSQDHTYTYLHNKRYERCIILLVPFIGNLIVALYDLYQYLQSETSPASTSQLTSEVPQNSASTQQSQEEMRRQHILNTIANQDIEPLLLAPVEYRVEYWDDRDIVLAAVTLSGQLLRSASPRLQDDEGIVQAAVTQNGNALDFASDRLKNNRDIVRVAIAHSIALLQYASEEIRGNEEFLRPFIQGLGDGLQFVSEDLQNNRNFVEGVVRRNGNALAHASDPLRDDRELVRIALRTSSRAFQYVGDDILNDRDFLLDVARYIPADLCLRIPETHREEIQHAAVELQNALGLHSYDI